MSTPVKSYHFGKVIKWDTEAYSQSAYITRNRVVYYVQGSAMTYKITRRHDNDVRMQAEQQIQFRIEDTNGSRGVVGHMFIFGNTGEETEYNIVGESR